VAFFSTLELDVVRISASARSPDWVWAEWMNMASNGIFNAHEGLQASGKGAVLGFR
jgi:hypothetical protein